LRQYELTYIVRPDADDETVAAVTARVGQVITTNGGRVLKVDAWGKRRLAYPIRRYTEGIYTLLLAELNDRAIRETERHLKLSEDVFRHLLVRVEPEAAEAVEPEAAAAPAKPAEAQPTAPAKPAAEAQPTAPAQPAAEAEPAEGGAPAEPAESAEPAEPPEPEPPAETD
jgi:small subunit ribosomal protein S6